MGPAPALIVVGGGKMGEALVAGLLRTTWASPEAITVVETDAGRRAELAARHPGLPVVGGVRDVARGAAGAAGAVGAVIAVKPADAEAACRALTGAGVGRVLSIAAGVTLASLESWLADAVAVVRAMPNTPALVGSGAAAIAGGHAAGADDLAWAQGILEAVGTVVTVPESDLDAVTGLSGSGPAYVFLLAEALIDAGVQVGLSLPVARQLVVQTVLGSARLLAETGDEPAALRAAVTSPGGTTAAGLRVLEAAGVRQAVVDAVAAATERSRELGKGNATV
ncbi:MAG TPA: pyrroline-5-carboxylate reductase [Acidimicrobiales bacterium]|jgi:pyrroline-5-carboxylate reductase